MNVLKFMRSSAILKYLLWLVILSFIIWIFAFYGGGRQTSNKGLGQEYAVKVRNRTLPPQALSLALQFQREKIRSMLGEEYVEQFMQNAPSQLASSLADSLILSYLADDYGLEVGESEIADTIVKAYKFQDPKTQYDMMLRMRGVTAQEFEALWKADLTRRKVMTFVASGFIFGDKEIENRYRDENSKFKAKMVLIRSSSFAKDVGEIADADAMAIFEREKGTLAIPERRTVKYVMISAASIRAGIDIPESEMQAYYESHKEKFGDKPFAQVKSQVKNVMLFGEKTYETRIKEAFDAATDEFRKAENETEILAVANKYKLQVSTAEGLEKDKPRVPFTGDPEVLEKVFQAKENQWSELVEMPVSSIRYCVTSVKAPHPATFDEVKADIKSRIKGERQTELARKAAFELKALAKDAQTLDDEAKKKNFQVQDSSELKVSDAMPMIGKDKKLSMQIFEGSVGQVSGPMETRDGFALACLLEKNPADMQKFKSEKTSFVEEQAQKEAQAYIEDYLSRMRQELTARGEIKINQEVIRRYDTGKGS
mgnify:CR=1 FL=1